MAIRPLGQPEKRPEPTKTEESKLAARVETKKESLLPAVLKEHKPLFQGVPILGAIASFFSSRGAKKDYVNQLESKFVAQAEQQGFTETQALSAFYFIKPILLEKNLKDISTFETFINNKHAVRFLLGSFTTTQDPREGKAVLKQTLATAVDALSKNPERVETFLNMYDQLDNLFGSNRISANDQNKIFNYFLIYIDNKEVSTRLENLKQFVAGAQHSDAMQYGLKVKADQALTFVTFAMSNVGRDFLIEAMKVHGNHHEAIATIIDDAIATENKANTDNLAKAFSAASRFRTNVSRDELFELKRDWMHKEATTMEFADFEQEIAAFTQREVVKAAKEADKSPFSSYLKNKSQSEKADFFNFVRSAEGAKFLQEAQSLYGNDEGRIQELVNTIIQASSMGNTQNLADVFQATIPIMAQSLPRLRPEDVFEYKQRWVEAAGDLETSTFKGVTQRFETHINYLTEVQGQKPKVFDQDSPERDHMIEEWMTLYSDFPNQLQQIRPFVAGMQEVSALQNRQLLQYSISGIYLGATLGGDRTAPFLNSRTDTPSALYNQMMIPYTLPKPKEGKDNADEVIENFQVRTEIYITDPTTMETRSISVLLPIQGRVTVGDAKKKLKILKAVLGSPGNPSDFDTAYRKSGLPLADKDITADAFDEFSRELGKELAHALGDFNDVGTPRESWVLEKPEMREALKQPNSLAKAIDAAKLQNLFLLKDGTLSLIPGEAGEVNQVIGTFHRQFMEKASQKLWETSHLEEKETTEPLALLLPVRASDQADFKPATLQFSLETEMIEPAKALIMTTTITQEGKSITRKSYYHLKGDDIAKTIEEITASKEFERDLLLAKAEFMKQHVK